MSSSILDLPKDVRLLIWEQAFESFPQKIFIGSTMKGHWKKIGRDYHPPLLQVCHTIRDEGLPLFYRDKTVALITQEFRGRDQIRRWVRQVFINPSVQINIRNVMLIYLSDIHGFMDLSLDLKNGIIENREEWKYDRELIAWLEPRLWQMQQCKSLRDKELPRLVRGVLRQMMRPAYKDLPNNPHHGLEPWLRLEIEEWT